MMRILIGFIGFPVVVLGLFMAGSASGQSGETYESTSARIAAFQPTQREVVVEPGDTLWDISSKISGSPWHWPRVWSYNPEIQNPHWIYPGDTIRFYPSENPLPDLSPLGGGGPIEEEFVEVEEVPEEEPIEEFTRPSRKLPTRRWAGVFVTKDELEASGELSNAFQDKLMLSVGDDIFVKFDKSSQKPEPGEVFLIFRELEKVRHPTKKKKWGVMTEITGQAKILRDENKKVVRARITHSFREIERGQLMVKRTVDPYIEVPKGTLASQKVEGVILAVGHKRRMAGDDQYVFLDQGKESGLKPGNLVRVFSDLDNFTDEDGFPATFTAQLLVVETKDRASTCLVVQSFREILPGDTFAAVTD